jgi:hypothetical protein
MEEYAALLANHT